MSDREDLDDNIFSDRENIFVDSLNSELTPEAKSQDSLLLKLVMPQSFDIYSMNL